MSGNKDLRTRSARQLTRVPIAPGPEGLNRLLPHLTTALDGSGPAIAPVPVVSPTCSQDYVASVLAAVHADDSSHPLESDDIALVVATSGSTGNPKGVLLAADTLAPGTAAANEGSAQAQWIAALPVYSMGGLNVVVRALAADRDPIAVGSLGGASPFTAEAFASAVNKATRHAADVRTSLVPAQLARLLASDEGIDALQACTQILIGGAPTRTSLMDACRELDITAITTYGSTETGGGCVFDGLAIPGARVEIVDGRVVIRGAVVARGYRCDQKATRESFHEGVYLTQDVGVFSDDGRLRITGRIDDVVIINGINVSPDAIAHVLADLPDVVAASVVAVSDANSEPYLVAFLEPREEVDDITVRACQAVHEALGRPAVPRHVVCLDQLPHLPNGKVDRALLTKWARETD